MHLFLNKELRRLHDEVGPILPVLAAPDQLGIADLDLTAFLQLPRLLRRQAQPRAVPDDLRIEALDDFPCLGAGRAFQLDVKAVGFRVIMKLHCSSSRKLRSKKALWTVSPSSSVTTRRTRGRASPGRTIFAQKRIRPSVWTSRRI